MRECEDQAIDACRKHLDTHDQTNLYVITTHRTRAKAWYYEKDNEFLITMDPEVRSPDSSTLEGYIEAHSSQAEKLKASFERMRTFPTGVVASTAPSSVFPRTVTADTRVQAFQGSATSRYTPVINVPPQPTQTGSRHSTDSAQPGQKKWEMVEFRRDGHGSKAGFFRRQGEEQWHDLTKDWRRQKYDKEEALVNDGERLYLFFGIAAL